MRYEINLCKHVTLCAHPQKCIRSHQQKNWAAETAIRVNPCSPPQFFIQLVFKPHLGTWILLFGLQQTHRKFILFIAVFQVAVIAIFCVFVRYDEELDSLFHANRTTGTSDGVMDNQYHSKYFSFHFPYS